MSDAHPGDRGSDPSGEDSTPTPHVPAHDSTAGRQPGGSPADQRPRDAVDAARRRLADVGDLEVDDRVAVFEAVNEVLVAELSALDEV